MKKLLLAGAFATTGYWGLLLWEESQIQEFALVEPTWVKEASVDRTLPVRRTTNANSPVGRWPAGIDQMAASTYATLQRESWGIRPYHDLEGEFFENPLGRTVVYRVRQGDVPVLGMQIEVQIGPNGEVSELLNTYQPVDEADLDQSVLPVEDLMRVTSDKFEFVNQTNRPIIFVPPAGGGHPELGLAMTVKVKGRKAESQAVFRASDGQLLGLTTARPEFKN